MTFINIDFTIRQFHSKQLQTSLFGKSVRIVVLLVVFLLGLFLAACSSTSKPPTIETAEEVSSFRLELSEELLIVAQGDSGQIAITMQGMKSLDDLELYVEDLPEELLDNTSLSTDGQGIFSVEASAEAVLSNYDLTLVAMVKGKESRANLRVEVVPTGQPSSKVSQLSTQATGEIPVISPIRNQSVIRNTNNPRTVKVNVRVTDPDNNSFRLKVNSRKRAVIPNQSWKSCNSPCRVNLTPVPDKTEKVRVTVVVRDPDGNRVSRSFRVNVVPRYVRNTSDSGSQSLRHRIEQAISGDVIGFKFDFTISDIPTIVLVQPLVIDKDLTIEGIKDLVISGHNATRIFTIYSAKVTITNMTIQNGFKYEGGGIYVDRNDPNIASNVTLISVNILGNKATNGGGMFIRNSRVTLRKSLLKDNEADSSGGGIFTTGTAKLIVIGSNVIDNMALDGGGGIYSGGEELKVMQNSSVSNNKARYGGGVVNVQGQAEFSNCSVSYNQALSTYADAQGGGIQNNGQASIIECVIESNITLANLGQAIRGGGIFNTGTLVATKTQITGNRAFTNVCNIFPACPNADLTRVKGGGIYNSGILTMSDSYVVNNTVESTAGWVTGGGIHSIGDFVLEADSYVTSNAANDLGAFNSPVMNYGGGVYLTGLYDIQGEVSNNSPDNIYYVP